MTGLAQLGHSPGWRIDEPEVAMSYDHYYLQHQSLTFDVEIIMKTLLRI